MYDGLTESMVMLKMNMATKEEVGEKTSNSLTSNVICLCFRCRFPSRPGNPPIAVPTAMRTSILTAIKTSLQHIMDATKCMPLPIVGSLEKPSSLNEIPYRGNILGYR